MSKVKWSKVKRGDVLDLNGIAWTVEKIKAKGSKAKVTIRNGSRVAESKVPLDAKVKLSPAAPAKAKARKPVRASATPPKPATGDPWETQQDRVEKKLDAVLGAKLIGEATDPDRGYYCPLPDVTTIAAHLLFYHGGIPESAGNDEGRMLTAHTAMHQLAEAGKADLPTNHWHTEKRPTSSKKKKAKKK